MADNLTQDQQNKINAFKDAYAAAQKRGDKAAMDAAHQGAEGIRNQAGYSGGTDGSEYVPMQEEKPVGAAGQPVYWNGKPEPQKQVPMTGDGRLNAQQQAQIQAFKDAYAQAQARGDRAGMDAAHQQAEALRKQFGNYSGGADGSGYSFGSNPVGGMTAEEMAQWVAAYDKANQNTMGPDGHAVYDNGYSVGMNLRSLANKIRQQMYANSQAYSGADNATKQYLHEQNLELAKILKDASGGAESTFNPKTGRWETYNGNLGYGTYVGGGYDDRDFNKRVYGMTDEQIDHYMDDPSRYYNFVDQQVVRNWQNEANGFTGEYAQFANGPYMQLVGGNAQNVPRSEYVDVEGDGWNEGWGPRRDADGNILPPPLKNNQHMTDYTRDKLGYIYNGVIQPNILNRGGGNNIYAQSQEGAPQYTAPAEHEMDADWQEIIRNPGRDHSMPVPGNNPMMGGGTGGMGGGSGFPGGGGGLPSGGGGGFGGSGSIQGGGGQFDGLINQMFDGSLAAQKAALEAAYKANTEQLGTTQAETNAAYQEQKRQTAGQSDRDAAAWRELANAQGLNTGAVGQAALAQNNQLQSDLNTLGAAQAEANARIEQQRALLAQKYQYDILKAQADNDFQRAQMLYQEAVRADEALRQQQQFYASLAADQAKAMMSLMAKGGGSTGGRRGGGGGGGRGSSGGGGGTILEQPNDPNDTTGSDGGDINYSDILFGLSGRPAATGGIGNTFDRDDAYYGGLVQHAVDRGDYDAVDYYNGLRVDNIYQNNPGMVGELGLGDVSADQLKQMIKNGYVSFG